MHSYHRSHQAMQDARHGLVKDAERQVELLIDFFPSAVWTFGASLASMTITFVSPPCLGSELHLACG